MTCAEYETLRSIVSADIEITIETFYSHEALEQLAREDDWIIGILNADAEFWVKYRAALKTAFFIALGRIFDTDQRAASIFMLVRATLTNVELFSRESLKQRHQQVPPEWLEAFIADAWVPTCKADLQLFREASERHARLFKAVYQPIRDRYYAHRDHKTFGVAHSLFEKTNRVEMAAMLNGLDAMNHSLFNLFMNGTKPVLGDSSGTHRLAEARDRLLKILEKIRRAAT